MRHRERLNLSFKQFWHSPALIGIAVLKALFAIATNMIMALILGALMFKISASFPQMGPSAFYAMLLVFINMYFCAYAVQSGFFSAGFFTMVRNTIQDGSTTLKEFLPGAKRYWSKFFRYIWVRLFIYFLFSLPLILTLMFIPPESITIDGVELPSLLPVHYIVLLVSALLSLFVNFFWLIWSEALIIYEDYSVWKSIKTSILLANKNVMKTAIMLAIGLLLLLVTVVGLLIFIVPYTILITMTAAPAQGLEPSLGFTVLDFYIPRMIIYSVFISLLVVFILFIFRTYELITGRKRIKKKVTKSKKKAKK